MIIGVTDWIVDGTASEGKFANSDGTGEYGVEGKIPWSCQAAGYAAT
jgi:hypothetical protein